MVDVGDPSRTIALAYDSAGRMTAIIYPGGTSSVAYGYDNANRLTSVTDWQSKVTSYTYDNANRLTSTTLGNGLISDRTYDNADRLLTVVNRNGGTTISSYTYTLDSVGNRTQTVDTTGTSTFTYDSLYRLTAVTYPNADTQSYTYDAMGNRLTKVHNGATTTSTYNDGDRMTAAGGTSYTYDNNGNQTAAGTDTYAWDAENRLTSASIGGVSSSYAYAGDGLRASRTVAGASVSYVWNRNAAMPSVLQDSAGNRYVYGLDLISREATGGTLEYFLYDGLGSTTGLSNVSGTVTGTYTYDVFGATRTQTGATTEWNYTGEQNEPTGLEYLRARYYDKANGRFISRDPLPLLQRYGYVNANPVNLTDPSGLMTAGEASKIILASGCWHKNKCGPIFAWIFEAMKTGGRWCWQRSTCTAAVGLGLTYGGVALMSTGIGAPIGAVAILAGTGVLAAKDGEGCVGGSKLSCAMVPVDVFAGVGAVGPRLGITAVAKAPPAIRLYSNSAWRNTSLTPTDYALQWMGAYGANGMYHAAGSRHYQRASTAATIVLPVAQDVAE